MCYNSVHNTKYRHHADPLFKRNNIVKVSDLYQLQVSFSFMHDLVNNKLPGSFDDFIPITNESNYYVGHTGFCSDTLKGVDWEWSPLNVNPVTMVSPGK